MALLPGFIDAVLGGELTPLRFEQFVTRLLSKAESVEYLPTSVVHDLGRDARPLRRVGDTPDVLAATISRGLDKKVLADVQRLLQTTKPGSLTYCTTANLTEQAIDKLEADIRRELAMTQTVRVLGLTQLRELSLRFESVFQESYRAELEEIRQFLSTEEEDRDRPDVTGLRLALLTQTGDDAVALRKEILQRLILEELLDGKSYTAATLAARVSARLRLGKTVYPEFFGTVAAELTTAGSTEDADGGIRITETGRGLATDVPADAVQRLIEGRVAVRGALARELGFSLSDADYGRFWPVFQQSLAELFYQHGLSIVRMVTSIQSGEATVENEGAFRIARQRLADHASAVFQNAEQREEVRQAVIDLLSIKGSPAFDWLTSVCAVFVMMCSLGLETMSAAEVAKALRGIVLLPDTDLLISHLCVGEPNHEEVVRVFRAWRSLGGQVRAPVPALEEVAYHAWIADSDYAQVSDLLSAMSDERAEYLVPNAFVRTFRRHARNPTSLREWNDFIADFQGRTAHDWSAVIEYLRNDAGIDPFADLPDSAAAEGDPHFGTVKKFLLRDAAADLNCEVDELDERLADKVRRDALILTTLILARERMRKTGGGSSAVVVSSARRLRRGALSFAKDLGQPDGVVSLAAIAALLSLVPGVHMGVGTLRVILFDLNLARRLSPAELFVYRVVQRSDQYELPLSRSVTLTRKLRQRLVSDAKKADIPVKQAEEELVQVRDVQRSAEAVRSVLDQMAITSAAGEKMAAQQETIKRLEQELAQMRTARARRS